ncbi:FMN-dependent NADH-azoreductase [bacterium E08(2017)]|nr:FMN-dependent NADH-azoreductase [bacterium E08(2017)]
MSKILYIPASPRADHSNSRAVAEAFLEAYKAANPDDEIDTLDVFQEDLPPFDGDTLNAKYSIMQGQEHTAEQKEAWSTVEEIIERFKSADKYLLAVPMWNFGIPYRLKQYLDIIIQPGYTFAVGEDGYSGLLEGKKATVVYARGGAYSEGEAANYDFQKRYLDLAFGFIGITDVESIVVEPMMAGGPEAAEEAKTAALEKATEAGKDF